MVKDSSRAAEVVSREYTINLGKRLHDIGYKKRAPRAVKAIRQFAAKEMKTSDVRLDVKLNQAVWQRVRTTTSSARRDARRAVGEARAQEEGALKALEAPARRRSALRVAGSRNSSSWLLE